MIFRKIIILFLLVVFLLNTSFSYALDENIDELFIYEPKRINSIEGAELSIPKQNVEELSARSVVPNTKNNTKLLEALDDLEKRNAKFNEFAQKNSNSTQSNPAELNLKEIETSLKKINHSKPPELIPQNPLEVTDSFNPNLKNEAEKKSEIESIPPQEASVDTPTEPKKLFFSDSLIKPIMLEARVDIPMDLDLRQALETALKNNLDLLASEKSIGIKKWKWIENVGGFLPDLSAGLSWRRFDGTFLIGGVFPVSATANSANVFTRFDYQFFDGGAMLFNTLAARKYYQSAGKDFEITAADVLLSVTKAYNNLLKQQARLNVLVDSVKEARENLALNENLEKRGVGTKFNVLQSKSLLAEEEQELLKQQAIFRQASVTLAVLLNLKQGIHIKPSYRDLKPKDLFDIETPIEEMIKIAKENRPEYKKLKLDYDAKRNLIGTAFADYLPKANVYGEIGGTGRSFFGGTKTEYTTLDGIRLDGSGDPIASGMVSNVIPGGGSTVAQQVDTSLMSTKTIGIEFNWQFGEGLGVPTLARIKQAQKEVEVAKIHLVSLENKIESEVRNAYLDVQAANRSIAVTEERVAASKESLRLSKLRLVNGIGINTELLNAQTEYKDSLASKVNAIIDYNNSQVDLLHKLGVISYDTILPNDKKLALNY